MTPCPTPLFTALRPAGVLALLALFSARPVTAQESAPPLLHVTGSAEVARVPDRATLHLGVETRGETADRASAENNRVMGDVMEALRGMGIPESRLRTQRLTLRPEQRAAPGERERTVVAYHAMNQVQVELEDVAAAGAVMDAAVRAGANLVHGVTLALEDSDEAYREALALAAERAREKAEALARALGAELGPMVEVVEGGAEPAVRRIENLPAPEPGAQAIMLRGVSAAPVSPGEVDVRATVRITWRLAR